MIVGGAITGSTIAFSKVAPDESVVRTRRETVGVTAIQHRRRPDLIARDRETRVIRRPVPALYCLCWKLDFIRAWTLSNFIMSLADLLEEVDRLNDAERTMLSRRLRARELAGDATRTADMAGRLDRMLAAEGVVTEQELRARIEARGAA